MLTAGLSAGSVERADCQAHQKSRAAICGNLVGMEDAADFTAVDKRPLAVFRTHTAIGSMVPPHSALRSPGSSSR